jgi:hypothetical protein
MSATESRCCSRRKETGKQNLVRGTSIDRHNHPRPPVSPRHFPPGTSIPRTEGESESWLPLSSEKRVREELKKRFEEDVERQGVLWSWVDWIASGAFLDADTEDITYDGGVYT